MKKLILISVLVLAFMEGVSWWVFRSNTSDSPQPPEVSQAPTVSPQSTSQSAEKESNSETENDQATIVPETNSSAPIKSSAGSEGSFPPPSTAVVHGVTERTIHMGVRQFAWDPKIIRAKEGELVRLIMHNADVKHGIAIPELGVNEDISPDGAIITFKATKKGTFEFLCSVYCGAGHALMQGKIIIE
jgi:cytochrome c oxidase subunit 2